MKRLLRVFAWLLGLAILAVLGVVLAAYVTLRASLPQEEGRMALKGLSAPVEVGRDGSGVVRIRAQTLKDLLFAQGFVHAQERLWQMEFQRRVGQGRLSEVLGEATLAQDRFLRTWGFYQAAKSAYERLYPEEKEAVDAYVAGVNAFLQSGAPLPPEFRLLGFRPEPWTGPDVLVWAKMMSFDLSGNWEEELLRHRLLARGISQERLLELIPPYPEDAPTILQGEDLELPLKREEAPAALLRMAPPRFLEASNNWVVAGSRTVTGKPFLANDPHLRLGAPSLWFLKAQVFLVGPPEVIAFLEEDEEFLELFPFRVEFSPEIPYTKENVAYLGGFLQAEGVALTPEGLSALADEARRWTGHKERLDARLYRLLDLAREASALKHPLDREAVEKALLAREERFGLEEELYLKDLEEGVVALEVQGMQVGEINGLVVVEGPLPRGRPVRITAQAGPGREGILSIDREVGLGGQVFHKAVLTLAGYLRGTYASLGALSATVSLVFEQSYGGIEGDSAGLAELLAVLSAISGLPLRQDLAVTGAIDQTGRVLAVGRVAEKVEGFFRVCQTLGLTGSQGVALPKANLPHLTLRKEVVEAVAKGRFHLYAVEEVDQAIELLFGRKAYWVHDKVREVLGEFRKMENGEENPSP
ncbi:penicillin acylase family protein [Thermus scotoductus]|uniref:penicillin acylase family protein n=1 Tax=Thermus scotoductus TaxID=37636 RepID=UPI0020A51158|nr:penicillin acylase family protein [Thermus scotoductus]